MRVWTYRHYVANSLRLLPQNQYLSMTLAEVFEPPVTMTGEEVIEEVMSKAGLKWE